MYGAEARIAARARNPRRAIFPLFFNMAISLLFL
jgi:hypothetical protein